MPIRWRLTLYIALVIGAILIVLGFALYYLNRGLLLSGVEATARSRATDAASTIESGKQLNDAYVGQLTLDGVVLLVRDDRGGLVRKENLPENGKIENTIWRKAERSGKPASGMTTIAGDDPYYVYAVPANPQTGTNLVVEAASPYEFAQHALETFGAVLVVGIGVAVLLSIGGAYILAGAALKPVDAVTNAARGMGEGDLAKRLPVAYANDEVGRLTITINGLLSRLQAAFGRREEALERQRRFAADASHELRTPLTSISGHARMLVEWAIEEDPEQAKRSAGAIHAAAGRMRNLIESLLALSRGDESTGIEIGRHDLAAVAEEAAQGAKAAAGGRVSVEYVRPEHAIEATFDQDRVFQVVSILLDNAVRYTGDGGTVLVRVEEENGGAALQVSDTGTGIPEDRLPLVFERFYRMDQSRADGGVGLGLSIARQIAEAHGGEIRVRSTPGKGSTFTLHLPNRPRPRS